MRDAAVPARKVGRVDHAVGLIHVSYLSLSDVRSNDGFLGVGDVNVAPVDLAFQVQEESLSAVLYSKDIVHEFSVHKSGMCIDDLFC